MITIPINLVPSFSQGQYMADDDTEHTPASSNKYMLRHVPDDAQEPIIQSEVEDKYTS